MVKGKNTASSSITISIPKLLLRTDDIPMHVVDEIPEGILGMVPTRVAARGIALRDDDILCVKRDLTGIWAIPGGGMEEGETPEQTVAREMLEETGFVVTRATYAVGVWELYGENLYVTHVFLCEGEQSENYDLTDEEEQASQRAVWQSIGAVSDEFAKGLPDEADAWYDEGGDLRPDLRFLSHYLPHVSGIYAREGAILRTLFPYG